MCLACEEQDYFFRVWCAGFLARGEMPPGVTQEDLDAMGFELPAGLRGKDKAERPASSAAVPSANPFACDSPDGE
jgi:hypothetical protein